MWHIPNGKIVQSIAPAAIVNNTTATATSVDTRNSGIRPTTVHHVVTIGATDVAATVFKIQESEDDSTYSDITGASFTGASNLPAATSDNTNWCISVPMGGVRMRYQKVVLTVGNATGAYVAGLAFFENLGQSANSNTERGVAGFAYPT